MKAISLYQPWASLMAYELKKVETRPKKISYRGPLLIQAAKRPMDIIHEQAIRDFEEIGVDWENLPYGCLVCKVYLVLCEPTEYMLDLSDRESSHGDYTPGRKAWITNFIKRFETPIPYRGYPWPFNVPDELINEM